MGETCNGTTVADAITLLGEESMNMRPHIQELLDRMEEIKEDIEDLAVNKAQETQALSIVEEMEKKVKACQTEMLTLENIGMATPMDAAAKTIKDLETHSLEMFTRLTMLESLHIVPGLESIRVSQLSYWNQWQAAAAGLKEIIFQYIKQ